MSQVNGQTLSPSFPPNAAIGEKILVYINSSLQAVACPKGTRAHGITARECDPSSSDLSKQRVTVHPLTGFNVLTCISAAACVAGAEAYQADNGKVDDVSTDAKYLGTFLTGATGANQEVEILQRRND